MSSRTSISKISSSEDTGTRAARRGMRVSISQAFSRVEDVVYVGLGVLLAASALVLLASTAVTFGRSLWAGSIPRNVIALLDQILLIVMIVEILSTCRSRFVSTYSPQNLS